MPRGFESASRMSCPVLRAMTRGRRPGAPRGRSPHRGQSGPGAPTPRPTLEGVFHSLSLLFAAGLAAGFVFSQVALALARRTASAAGTALAGPAAFAATSLALAFVAALQDPVAA